MQHTKKSPLTPDLDGQRTSYSKTTGKKKKKDIFNDCSQIVNPLGNSGEPSSLTYSNQNSTKLSSSHCDHRKGRGREAKTSEAMIRSYKKVSSERLLSEMKPAVALPP